jgi:hypothetical protein
MRFNLRNRPMTGPAKRRVRFKHYFIEQEEFTGDPMTELREDAEYMRNFNV